MICFGTLLCSEVFIRESFQHYIQYAVIVEYFSHVYQFSDTIIFQVIYFAIDMGTLQLYAKKQYSF